MAPFLYRCPNTGRQVQGLRAITADANEGAGEGSQRYQAVECLACAQVHFVDPATGKVLGGEEA